jgi:hypothetical protein
VQTLTQLLGWGVISVAVGDLAEKYKPFGPTPTLP